MVYQKFNYTIMFYKLTSSIYLFIFLLSEFIKHNSVIKFLVHHLHIECVTNLTFYFWIHIWQYSIKHCININEFLHFGISFIVKYSYLLQNVYVSGKFQLVRGKVSLSHCSNSLLIKIYNPLFLRPNS